MDGDLPITEKYAPDAGSDIAINPRLLGGPLGKNAKMMACLPEFLLGRVKMKLNNKSIASFRQSCDRISSAVCVRGGIDMEDKTVPAADGYAIPIRIYRSENCAPGCGCLLFFYGGAFIGGSIPPYDEGWKVFVEKFSMVVVSVGYRLMPDAPTPPHTRTATAYWNGYTATQTFCRLTKRIFSSPGTAPAAIWRSIVRRAQKARIWCAGRFCYMPR